MDWFPFLPPTPPPSCLPRNSSPIFESSMRALTEGVQNGRVFLSFLLIRNSGEGWWWAMRRNQRVIVSAYSKAKGNDRNPEIQSGLPPWEWWEWESMQLHTIHIHLVSCEDIAPHALPQLLNDFFYGIHELTRKTQEVRDQKDRGKDVLLLWKKKKNTTVNGPNHISQLRHELECAREWGLSFSLSRKIKWNRVLFIPRLSNVSMGPWPSACPFTRYPLRHGLISCRKRERMRMWVRPHSSSSIFLFSFFLLKKLFFNIYFFRKYCSMEPRIGTSYQPFWCVMLTSASTSTCCGETVLQWAPDQAHTEKEKRVVYHWKNDCVH